MKLTLEELHQELSIRLNEIAEFFVSPKITLVVRADNIPNGDGDLVITSDDLEEAKKSITQLQIKEGTLPENHPIYTVDATKLDPKTLEHSMKPGGVVAVPSVSDISPILNVPISLVVWDLETTGFDGSKDKILEIGAILFHTNGTTIKKRWVLQNNCEISEEITAINGFTKEIVDAEGVDPEGALIEFLDYLTHTEKNVTHNGFRFDIPFLIAYASTILAYTPEEMEAIRKQIVKTAFDTAVHFKAAKINMTQRPDELFPAFAHRVMGTFAKGVKFNLALCAEESGIDTTGIVAHRALGDCEVTHLIYKKLMNADHEDLPF